MFSACFNLADFTHKGETRENERVNPKTKTKLEIAK